MTLWWLNKLFIFYSFFSLYLLLFSCCIYFFSSLYQWSSCPAPHWWQRGAARRPSQAGSPAHATAEADAVDRARRAATGTFKYWGLRRGRHAGHSGNSPPCTHRRHATLIAGVSVQAPGYFHAHRRASLRTSPRCPAPLHLPLLVHSPALHSSSPLPSCPLFFPPPQRQPQCHCPRRIISYGRSVSASSCSSALSLS